MLVTMRALALRRQMPDVFNFGEYVPLVVRGEAAEHLVAFARNYGDQWTVTAVPRHLHRLRGRPTADHWGKLLKTAWGDTEVVLPAGSGIVWRCALSGRLIEAAANGDWAAITVAKLFDLLPVALLELPKY